MQRFSRVHAERMEHFLNMLGEDVYPEQPSQLHSDITHKAFKRLAELMPFRTGMKALDVGCGQAPALALFQQAGVTPLGITIGEEDLNVCRTRGFTVAEMDQSFLEFADQTFDIIWARHVIEHSIFPFFTLSGFKRVLKPSGMLYLEVPAPDTPCHHERNPNHYSVLTRSLWISLLERAGYIINECVSYRFTVAAGDDEYWGFYCRRATL